MAVSKNVSNVLIFVQQFSRSFANASLTDEDIHAILQALGPKLTARIREVLARGAKT